MYVYIPQIEGEDLQSSTHLLHGFGGWWRIRPICEVPNEFPELDVRFGQREGTLPTGKPSCQLSIGSLFSVRLKGGHPISGRLKTAGNVTC